MPRSENFSPADKELLVNLVEAFKGVVLCKKTDGISNLRKEEGWRRIEQFFNSMTNNKQRDAKQLKVFWRNMKRRSKVHEVLKTLKMEQTGEEVESSQEDTVTPSTPIATSAVKTQSIGQAQIEPNSLNSFDCESLVDLTGPESSSLDVLCDTGVTINVFKLSSSKKAAEENTSRAALEEFPEKLVVDDDYPGENESHELMEDSDKTSEMNGCQVEKEATVSLNGLQKTSDAQDRQEKDKTLLEKRMLCYAKVEHEAKMAVCRAKMRELKRKTERREELHSKKMKLLEKQIEKDWDRQVTNL